MARDFMDFGEGVLVPYVVALAVAVLGAVAGILPAEARRVALVIGNAEYKVGPLANPVHDAAAVAEALEKQLKFDTVLLRRNLSLDGFRAALREMASQSRGAELGVVFFAGHGIETGGRNYLIPTDAALAASADIDLEAIALDTVLRQLEGVTRLRLVILDACRNSPFPAATRGVRGLVRIEPDLGTLVAYAAKDGTVADDGKGRHSPFTAALLKRIAAPGLDVRRVFGYVSEDVMAATGRRQEPFLYGRLGGDEVYLMGSDPAGLTPGHTGPASKPPPQSSEAERAWATVKDSTGIAVLEAFRRQYGATNAFYDRLAEARIDELRRRQLALLKAEEEKKRTEADLRPGRVFRDCDVCPEMVVVPAGSFMMGSSPAEIAALVKETKSDHNRSEGPQRTVTIAKPFAVGKFEVTFAEWDACVAAGGCKHRPNDHGWGRGRRPVIDVSWNDITGEYVPWMSRKTGKTYRLLSEAEWEYAARAGTTTPYATGRSITKAQANFGNVEGTVDVGSFQFQPNAFGLHDMHGNVWEWVQDCWDGSYTGAPSDGSAWTTGDCSSRVLRGGAWNNVPRLLRSAYRNRTQPDARYITLGFRLARTL